MFQGCLKRQSKMIRLIGTILVLLVNDLPGSLLAPTPGLEKEGRYYEGPRYIKYVNSSEVFQADLIPNVQVSSGDRDAFFKLTASISEIISAEEYSLKGGAQAGRPPLAEIIPLVADKTKFLMLGGMYLRVEDVEEYDTGSLYRYIPREDAGEVPETQEDTEEGGKNQGERWDQKVMQFTNDAATTIFSESYKLWNDFNSVRPKNPPPSPKAYVEGPFTPPLENKYRFILYMNGMEAYDLAYKTLTSQNWKIGKPVKVIIHGFTPLGFGEFDPHRLLNESRTYEIAKAYRNQSKHYNIIIVDWTAATAQRNNEFDAIAEQFKSAADSVEEFLLWLNKKSQIKIELHEEFQIIGIALGAQLAGAASNRINAQLETKVERITAVNPSGAEFANQTRCNKETNQKNNLGPYSARFVDVLYCNRGCGEPDRNKHLVSQFGQIPLMGHANFYLNGGINQPNCKSRDLPEDGCSHRKCLKHFIGTVANNKHYFAKMCTFRTKSNQSEECIVVEDLNREETEVVVWQPRDGRPGFGRYTEQFIVYDPNI